MPGGGGGGGREGGRGDYQIKRAGLFVVPFGVKNVVLVPLRCLASKGP